MAVRPINYTAEGARLLLGGHCTQERRFGSTTFDKARSGDLLWLREPFRFEEQWDARAPREIVVLSGRAPQIAFDSDGPAPSGFGRRRTGYTLPRRFSRAVLRVIDVRTGRLQDIGERDLVALGRTRAACEEDWSIARLAARRFDKRADGSWADNPMVTIVDFKLIEGNIDRLPGRSHGSPPATGPAADGGRPVRRSPPGRSSSATRLETEPSS